MSGVHPLLSIIGFASLAAASSYALLTTLAVLIWHRQTVKPASRSAGSAPVTLLKPLCGAEPGLYEHLRSFCCQSYPEFQIVFGVRDPSDPALAVVERLVHEFPSLSIDVVVNSQQHGSNYKNSNLVNMLARARHDLLVIADSDTWVEPDYLATVTGPLLDRQVGLVTCLYVGVATEGLWSRLGAMYINDWYAPSVMLAWLFGHSGYASGQTLCLRRETLQAIGGLHAIANHLADDYRLGELIRGLGLRIVLSPYPVKAEHDEPDLDSLMRHELRWMRTIRVLRPTSFRFIFFTFMWPLALVGIALTAADSTIIVPMGSLFALTLVCRLVMHAVNRRHHQASAFADVWLLPIRDLLICWVWYRTFFTSRITWRGSEFDVDADGVMHRV